MCDQNGYNSIGGAYTSKSLLNNPSVIDQIWKQFLQNTLLFGTETRSHFQTKSFRSNAYTNNIFDSSQQRI